VVRGRLQRELGGEPGLALTAGTVDELHRQAGFRTVAQGAEPGEFVTAAGERHDPAFRPQHTARLEPGLRRVDRPRLERERLEPVHGVAVANMNVTVEYGVDGAARLGVDPLLELAHRITRRRPCPAPDTG
jgi:hypothetical protein